MSWMGCPVRIAICTAPSFGGRITGGTAVARGGRGAGVAPGNRISRFPVLVVRVVVVNLVCAEATAVEAATSTLMSSSFFIFKLLGQDGSASSCPRFHLA